MSRYVVTVANPATGETLETIPIGDGEYDLSSHLHREMMMERIMDAIASARASEHRTRR